jgi:hypothetical protein
VLCCFLAALFLSAAIHFATNIHRAHTGPHLCYDIVHGNYVSCGGDAAP